MFIGWVGIETRWCHTPPQVVEAFLYCPDALHHHVSLQADRLLGQRRMHSQLQALLKCPIAYSTHELEHASQRQLHLAASMWEQPYRRAQWRAQCVHPHMHAFHSAFIDRPVPPMNSITGVAGGAPLRPRHGLCYQPGYMRLKLLLPDANGTCLCHEPWQVYAKCWEPRPHTLPPTMAKAARWTLLGAGHGATRIGNGEWWMCEGVV